VLIIVTKMAEGSGATQLILAGLEKLEPQIHADEYKGKFQLNALNISSFSFISI